MCLHFPLTDFLKRPAGFWSVKLLKLKLSVCESSHIHVPVESANLKLSGVRTWTSSPFSLSDYSLFTSQNEKTAYRNHWLVTPASGQQCFNILHHEFSWTKVLQISLKNSLKDWNISSGMSQFFFYYYIRFLF